jgi:hypothetical protein
MMVDSTAVLRAELRHELADSRGRFHAMLDAIPPEAWEGRSANPGWNVRQVVGHLADQPDAAATLVALARSGRGLLNHAPIWLVDFANGWRVRLQTRGLTQQSARERFERGFERLVALVDDIGDDEFDLAATAFRERHTVADAFRELGRQLDDHVPQVLEREVRPLAGEVRASGGERACR